jgi:hypothetical protein
MDGVRRSLRTGRRAVSVAGPHGRSGKIVPENSNSLPRFAETLQWPSSTGAPSAPYLGRRPVTSKVFEPVCAMRCLPHNEPGLDNCKICALSTAFDASICPPNERLRVPAAEDVEDASCDVMVSMRTPARLCGSSGSTSRFDADLRQLAGRVQRFRNVRKKFESRHATVMARRTLG